jgi:hypothetical protein
MKAVATEEEKVEGVMKKKKMVREAVTKEMMCTMPRVNTGTEEVKEVEAGSIFWVKKLSNPPMFLGRVFEMVLIVLRKKLLDVEMNPVDH